MRRAQTISLQIDYPFDDSYRFLADPLNYGAWAAVNKDSYRPLANGDWEADTAIGGKRHFRFTPVNEFGVLDHAVFKPGETPVWIPMRVMANDAGTELTVTFFQKPDMSDDEFASTIEWITTDLLTLKSLLEALRS